jgi:hypothetical protein
MTTAKRSVPIVWAALLAALVVFGVARRAQAQPYSYSFNCGALTPCYEWTRGSFVCDD